MRHLPDSFKRPITFVLVEPREAGNAGMVARAMANFDLFRLIIVGADSIPAAPDQVTARAEGRPILENARRAPDLQSALAPFHVVIGVTRRRGKHRPADLGPFDLREFFGTLPPEAEAAFVFGREADGLRAEEAAQCGRLLTIPTSARAPSLNLAQAAGVVAFSIHSAGLAGVAGSHSGESPVAGSGGGTSPTAGSHPGDFVRSDDPPVTQADLDQLFRSLEHALSRIGFLQGDRGPDTMTSLRRILSRAIVSERELRLLLSLAKKIGSLPAGR